VWFVIFLTVIFFLIFKLFQTYSPTTVQETESLKPIENISQEKIIPGIPIRIKIDSLDIDASLESVGLTSEGAIEVPKELIDAAWYNLGPRPGEVGVSIIDGHSGWKNGTQSVFDNLYRIEKGDRIYIEDEKGTITTFIVQDFKIYNVKDDVSTIFSSSDDKAHLNLITCVIGQSVNQTIFNDRFIVFADMEE